jgi:hypothetical protein
MTAQLTRTYSLSVTAQASSYVTRPLYVFVTTCRWQHDLTETRSSVVNTRTYNTQKPLLFSAAVHTSAHNCCTDLLNGILSKWVEK